MYLRRDSGSSQRRTECVAARRCLCDVFQPRGDHGDEAMTSEAEILRAIAAYYRAFRMGDHALMGRIWNEGDVTCLHPGWSPITCHDEQVIVTVDVAGVICVKSVAAPRLIATNLFIHRGADWRMIHHHASPPSAPQA